MKFARPEKVTVTLRTVDRWAVPHWIPLGNVYSIGDVLIAIGVFLAIVAAMRAHRPVAVAPALG